MGLMSGLAFSATLDHAEEIANIKKRLDKIEKRLAELEKNSDITCNKNLQQKQVASKTGG